MKLEFESPCFLGYELESSFFTVLFGCESICDEMIIRAPPPGCFFPLSSLLAFIILLVNTGFAVFMCIDVHMCFFVDMFLEVFFFPRIFLVAKLDQDTQNTQHVYTAHDEDLQTYDQVSLKKNNNAYTYIYICIYINIYIYIYI